MSGRGGKREGAGRKPALTYMQCVNVGGECERRWREVCEQKMETALAETSRLVRQQWNKFQTEPRKAGKTAREWLDSEDGENYLDDVRGALQEAQGIDMVDDDRDPARLRRVNVPRPKDGSREAIITAVANEYALAPSRVDRCWKEFRNVEAKLNEDLD